jgi:diacylglycerol kinase family enzyme
MGVMPGADQRGDGRTRLAAFVVNGTRMRGRGDLPGLIAAAARAHGWPAPLVLATTASDPGGGPTRAALAAGVTLVVAVGGDGTVRACAQELAGTDVPLAIVPTGSANLIAQTMGVPRRLRAAVGVSFSGVDRRIDLVGVDDMIGAAMAGIGLDAAVVGATRDQLKRRAGWPAYAAASLGKLLTEPTEFTIRLDAGPLLVRRARSVFVGNCGILPGGFPILPAARPDDGILDVGVLAPDGPAGWVSVGYRAISGSRRDDERLVRYRARAVEVSAARPLPRQVDGEIIPVGDRLSVRVLPGALLVRAPRPAR